MTKYSQRPFGWRDNVGYMFGNIGGDLVFGLCSGFLMKFYTDVMNVPAAIIGIMMMIAQVLDAVTDIGMGQICDKCPETKTGKFKPWIRRIAGPLALCSFLMYAVWFRDMSMTFKVVWMFVTYLLYCSIFYTAYIVPYGSMATAITSDPDQRTALANMRNIGGTVGMMFINVLLPLLVYYKDADGKQQISGTRLTMAAAIVSVTAFILYIACYVMTTERVKIPSSNQTGWKGVLISMRDTLRNRSTIGVALVVILYEVGRQAKDGMSAYFYPNYLESVKAQSMAGVIETVVGLIMALAVVAFVKKFGKQLGAALAMGFTVVMMLVSYFLHVHTVGVWLLFDTLFFVGIGLWGGIQWSLVGDIVDDTEVRTGTRADGGIYGVFSFSRKLGQAIASGIRGVLLSLVGYSAATAATSEVTEGIFTATTLVPAITFGVMILVLMTVYPLNKKRVDRNAQILAERRREADIKQREE